MTLTLLTSYEKIDASEGRDQSRTRIHRWAGCRMRNRCSPSTPALSNADGHVWGTGSAANISFLYVSCLLRPRHCFLLTAVHGPGVLGDALGSNNNAYDVLRVAASWHLRLRPAAPTEQHQLTGDAVRCWGGEAPGRSLGNCLLSCGRY